MYVSTQIKSYAKTVTGLEQYSIEKFGEAFESVPRTLAENAGLNVNEVMANLVTSNNNDNKIGINIKNGQVQNALELNVYDHLESKIWAIKYAVDAILKIGRAHV